MRLISLAASEATFKTVSFNESGVSFILAKQEQPEQFDSSKTYNGVGKSLLIALIHFCLGASSTNKITKSLQAKLPNWHFILKIKIDNQIYTIVRHTSAPKHISLNDEQLTVIDFCSNLEKMCFTIPPGFQYLSFRSLLPFFIRPSKHSYMNYKDPVTAGSAYQKQLYNVFLLDLDIALAQTKMKLKEQIDETKKRHDNTRNDPILKSFFQGSKDPSLALADINEKIKKLELDLQTFEIADNYYQLKKEADSIKKDLDNIQNKIKLKEINIENINHSMNMSPNIKRSDIQNIYDESKLIFQLNVKQQLIKLEEFYKNLTINRTKRLQQQKHQINSELKELKKYFAELVEDFDKRMKFLNAHQALDVFVKMSSRLADLQQSKEKLLDYEKLQHEYELKKTSLKKDMLSQSEETSSYLEQVKPDISKIMEYFRELGKRFYPEHSAGITVYNNIGKNKIRFDIDAKIESDSSDGINSVKLFCYDLTLLMKGSNHAMNCIFHDSRLFSNIDEPHCNILFEIIKNRFTEMQYIASINQNQLNSLSDEIKDFVNENVILELTDDSDAGKLLGVTVELEYD